MLLEISDKLSPEQLDKLKFLCVGIIGKKKSAEFTSGIQLFDCLIERAEIGPNNTELLRKLLSDVGQHVLLEKIERYEGQASSSELPDETQLGL